MAVYFAQVGRYFKIGASEDPERRVAQLHRGSARYTWPADAPITADARTLYRVIDGWKDRELHVHQALEDFSVGLEWFLDEPEVRAFIDSLPTRETSRMEFLPKVVRPSGPCEAEYLAVQAGRAEREMARFDARRSA